MPRQNENATPDATPENAPQDAPNVATVENAPNATNAPDAPNATPDATEDKTPVRIANLDPVATRIGLSPQRTRNLTKETDDNGAPLLRTSTVTIPGTDVEIVIIPEDAVLEYIARRDLPQSDPRAIKTRISGKNTTAYTVHVPNEHVSAFVAYLATIGATHKARATQSTATDAPNATDGAPVSDANVTAENTRRANALANGAPQDATPENAPENATA